MNTAQERRGFDGFCAGEGTRSGEKGIARNYARVDSLAVGAPLSVYIRVRNKRRRVGIVSAQVYTYIGNATEGNEMRRERGVRRGMKCGVASRYCRRLQIKYPISLFGTSQAHGYPPTHSPFMPPLSATLTSRATCTPCTPCTPCHDHD